MAGCSHAGARRAEPAGTPHPRRVLSGHRVLRCHRRHIYIYLSELRRFTAEVAAWACPSSGTRSSDGVPRIQGQFQPPLRTG
jgi:hypothetical protein